MILLVSLDNVGVWGLWDHKSIPIISENGYDIDLVIKIMKISFIFLLKVTNINWICEIVINLRM